MVQLELKRAGMELKNTGMLWGAVGEDGGRAASRAGQISRAHSSSRGECRQRVYKVLGSGLHSWEEKNQSSAVLS